MCRRKYKAKISAEVNEIETRKIIEKINETKKLIFINIKLINLYLN